VEEGGGCPWPRAACVGGVGEKETRPGAAVAQALAALKYRGEKKGRIY